MYIFQKTNITFSQIPKRTCAYRGICTVSFSKYILFILNGWSLTNISKFGTLAEAGGGGGGGGLQPLAIIKKLSILDVAAALDPPLH